jgi:hypothetical protein
MEVSWFEKKRLANPKKRTVNRRLPKSSMNLRDLTKAQAKRLGPIIYDAWKTFKRNELKRLLAQAKELKERSKLNEETNAGGCERTEELNNRGSLTPQ